MYINKNDWYNTLYLLLGNCGDLSDCESFGNKIQDQKNQNKQNINSSRASLLSASSHPEIRPFFKVSFLFNIEYNILNFRPKLMELFLSCSYNLLYLISIITL